MDKNRRIIESLSELFSLVDKEVEILYKGVNSYHWLMDIPSEIQNGINAEYFTYKEEVEIVELWGWKETRARWWDSKELENNLKPFTRKRTQIIQNGEIIWTKTEKI